MKLIDKLYETVTKLDSNIVKQIKDTIYDLCYEHGMDPEVEHNAQFNIFTIKVKSQDPEVKFNRGAEQSKYSRNSAEWAFLNELSVLLLDLQGEWDFTYKIIV